jgi:hypothetical protein
MPKVRNCLGTRICGVILVRPESFYFPQKDEQLYYQTIQLSIQNKNSVRGLDRRNCRLLIPKFIWRHNIEASEAAAQVPCRSYRQRSSRSSMQRIHVPDLYQHRHVSRPYTSAYKKKPQSES